MFLDMFLLLSPVLSVGSVSVSFFVRPFCLLFRLREGGGSSSDLVLLLQKLLHLAVSIFLMFFYLLRVILQYSILLPPVSTFVCFVPYQHGDSGESPSLNNLKLSAVIIILDTDVTSLSKQLCCDGRFLHRP